MKRILWLMILYSGGLDTVFDQALAEEQQNNVLNKTLEDSKEDEEDMSSLSGGVQTDQVLLRGLNKVTAHTQDVVLPIGQKVKFGDLEIIARLCQKSPPEESPEATAFLDVYEKKERNVSSLIFSGWMFASTPAVSALEHPVYDVWVLDCRGQIIHELPSAELKSDLSSFKSDLQVADLALKQKKLSSARTENQRPVDIFNQAFKQGQ